VHSGEKPYECEQCHRRFQQQGDLKRHMLRHAETTWYHCQPCDKRFMRVDRWKAHMKTHEENGSLGPPEVSASMVEMSNGATVVTVN
jgi:DNA-directed RNA polymerase subunit RPC12/RpoP